MSLNTQTGLALRGVRDDEGVTAAELAEAMCIAVDSLYRIERGAANVMMHHIELAADRLGKTPAGLFSALARKVDSMAHAAQKVEL